MKQESITQPHAEEERIVRLAIYLPESLHKAIRHRCIEERVSASKLAVRLLTNYLKTPTKQEAKEG